MIDVEERIAPGAPAAEESRKRRQILDGARQVFLAEGFDGASMGQIAKSAGVSKGTLYVYFDSKEALFEALTILERHTLAEAIFRLDETEDDVPAVLRRIGMTLMEAMVLPDHVASVRMVIGAADKFPRFGRIFYEAGPLQGATRLQAYLDRQVAAGRLAIDDTSLAAHQFLDLCTSRILKRLLFAGQAPAPAEIKASVEGALRVFFAAYGPKAATS